MPQAGCGRSCGCSRSRAPGTTSACSGVGMGYAAEPLLDELAHARPGAAHGGGGALRRVLQLQPEPRGAGARRAGAGRVRGRAGRADEPAAHGALRSARRARRPALLGRAWCRRCRRWRSRPWCSAPVPGRSRASCWRTTRCGSARRWWSLRTGLREGLQVGGAVGRSWLPRAAERVGPMAGLRGRARRPAGRALAAAGPRADARWRSRSFLAAGGVALSRWGGTHYSAVRYALVVLMLLAAGGMVML